jgi:hypothetical protein
MELNDSSKDIVIELPIWDTLCRFLFDYEIDSSTGKTEIANVVMKKEIL